MRLKILLYTMSIYLVILVQATLADYIKIYGVKPNILVVFIISVALLRGNVEGAVVGFFTGLSQDMLSGKILGFYCLFGLYLGVIIGSVNKRLYRDNFAVIVFFTFISTVIYEWMVYFFNTFMRNQIDLIYPIRNVILPEAIYNSVISILVYAVVLRLDMRLEGINKITRKY